MAEWCHRMPFITVFSYFCVYMCVRVRVYVYNYVGRYSLRPTQHNSTKENCVYKHKRMLTNILSLFLLWLFA